jgi:hypothetical protein
MWVTHATISTKAEKIISDTREPPLLECGTFVLEGKIHMYLSTYGVGHDFLGFIFFTSLRSGEVSGPQLPNFGPRCMANVGLGS